MLVTKMPCRLQKTNVGLTASSSAAIAATSGPPSLSAIFQVKINVRAARNRGSARSETVFTPPTARKGIASSTFRLPM